MAVARLRTLVIDDSADLRELLAVALEQSGRFEVVGSAGDASEGVALAGSPGASVELVLLDLAMPGIGGLEALPMLRAAAPSAAVVMMSGYPRSDFEGRAVGGGAAAYVEKGMSLSRFVDRVVAAAGLLELVSEVLSSSFDQDLRSGGQARRFVTEALERWDCAGALDVVQLLVSELVTNAVVHAGSRPSVSVVLRPTAVRIEVADTGAEGLAPRVATDDEESGRGLLLLDELASAWGVDPAADGTGKVVWFEVPRFDVA